jgi:hypothetical protein
MYESHMKLIPTTTGIMSVPKTLTEIMVDELFYASKALRSIESGFVSLQIRKGLVWVDADEYSDAWYVCAAFNDGSHIPLPLLLPSCPAMGGMDLCEPEWALQEKIIKIAIESGLLNCAVTCCADIVSKNCSSFCEEQLKKDANIWLDEMRSRVCEEVA